MDTVIHEIPKVLIVDDVAVNVRILKQMIERMGYDPYTATSVAEAIELINQQLPNIILSDIAMPDMNGYQFCEILKGNVLTRDIPVIFVSAIDEMKERQKAFDIGAVDFINKPYEYPEIAMRLDTHLKLYYMKKELEEKNKRLNLVVQEQARQLEKEQKRMLEAFSSFTEERNSFDRRKHGEYVSHNARLLAQALNFTERYENQISANFVDSIGIAASIHDIGTIAIPEDILKKRGHLSKEEKACFEQHTTKGYDLLSKIYGDTNGNEFVAMALEIVRSHHENWDGSGYPDQLKAENIPLSARILAIIDNFDYLIRDNDSTVNSADSDILQIMKQNVGTKFDPYIMEVFFKIEKQLKRAPLNEEGSTS